MITAIYPGSFDPLTYGHLDIIRRGAKLADRLVAGVLINASKTALFSVEERVQMLREAVKDFPNVEVRAFGGLTIEFAREEHANFILRGVRGMSDFDYEMQLAKTNRMLAGELETVFLPANPLYDSISSSIVKEVVSYNGDIGQFVPEFVEKAIHRKMNKESEV